MGNVRSTLECAESIAGSFGPDREQAAGPLPLSGCYARPVSNERELKFSTLREDAPNDVELGLALDRAGFELGPGARIRNKDRYFDDSRLSLSRAGVALRRRMSEGQMLATLKTRGRVDGALHDREEIELPMEGQEWPKPILDRIATVTAPGFLQPHTVIETERVRYAVLMQGKPVAQLAFDSVSARAQQGERSVGFDEVEIEALGSTPVDTLERIAGAVGELIALAPNSSSKLERVRQLLMVGDWQG